MFNLKVEKRNMKKEEKNFNRRVLIESIFLIILSIVCVNAQSYSSFTVQRYQPTIQTLYSSQQIAQYWPILSNEVQCVGRQDFIVQIDPAGCTPAVVRSDLLEEQNVPVFCKLDAIKLNPLIDVKAISSISPGITGGYPKEIAGLGYYPARAALNSYDKLLGSPIVNNIGYVVIVLNRQPVEKDMPDFVKGNLTAVIQYDLGNAWGVGKSEYYLPMLSDEEWQRNYKEYGFWRGKGYLRLDWIEQDRAEVSIYSDADELIAKKVIGKGNTSDEIYLPGYYCLVGMQLKLQDLAVPDVSARLRVGDDEIVAHKGSYFLDNQCQVNDITS